MKISNLRVIANVKQVASNLAQKRHIYRCPVHTQKNLSYEFYGHVLQYPELYTETKRFLVKRKMKEIDKQFDNLFGSKKKEQWLRGLWLLTTEKNYDVYRKTKAGDTINLFCAYPFITKKESIAKDFALANSKNPDKKGSFLFHITTLPGTKISRSNHCSEGVLKRDTFAKVDRVIEEPSGFKHIYATVVKKIKTNK